TPGGTRARFVHALVRDTLYEGIALSRLRAIHRDVAEAIAAASSADPDLVAFHFHRASDVRAVEWLLKAGERARRSWAWLTAADRFEAALPLLAPEQIGERARLLYMVAVLRRNARPWSVIDLLDQ